MSRVFVPLVFVALMLFAAAPFVVANAPFGVLDTIANERPSLRRS